MIGALPQFVHQASFQNNNKPVAPDLLPRIQNINRHGEEALFDNSLYGPLGFLGGARTKLPTNHFDVSLGRYRESDKKIDSINGNWRKAGAKLGLSPEHTQGLRTFFDHYAYQQGLDYDQVGDIDDATRDYWFKKNAEGDGPAYARRGHEELLKRDPRLQQIFQYQEPLNELESAERGGFANKIQPYLGKLAGVAAGTLVGNPFVGGAVGGLFNGAQNDFDPGAIASGALTGFGGTKGLQKLGGFFSGGQAGLTNAGPVQLAEFGSKPGGFLSGAADAIKNRIANSGLRAGVNAATGGSNQVAEATSFGIGDAFRLGGGILGAGNALFGDRTSGVGDIQYNPYAVSGRTGSVRTGPNGIELTGNPEYDRMAGGLLSGGANQLRQVGSESGAIDRQRGQAGSLADRLFSSINSFDPLEAAEDQFSKLDAILERGRDETRSSAEARLLRQGRLDSTGGSRQLADLEQGFQDERTQHLLRQFGLAQDTQDRQLSNFTNLGLFGSRLDQDAIGLDRGRIQNALSLSRGAAGLDELPLNYLDASIRAAGGEADAAATRAGFLSGAQQDKQDDIGDLIGGFLGGLL